MDNMKPEKEKLWEIFWVQTPTALVRRSTITPEELSSVVYTECEYRDESRGIKIFQKDNPFVKKFFSN